MSKLIVFCVCLTLCLSFVSSYKFLGILHTSAQSHYFVGSALMKGLAAKGHEVTVIAPFSQKTPIKNYKEVLTPSIHEVMKAGMNSLLDSIKKTIVENMLEYYEMGLQITDATLHESSVKELMRSNATFDAVICEVFLSEALYGLADHFNAPLIGLGTFGAISWNTEMVGSPSPPSYVPNAMLHFTDHMTLSERIGNLAMATFDLAFNSLYYLPRQEKIFNKHFPHLKRSMYEIKKNTALVLLNQHVSLSFARPYMPNHVEVGGMQINPNPKPLPADIEKFINESEHGVIYFSMGSNLKSKNLPIEKRREILNTFRGLKQRVLWKFEESNLEDKPDNVFIKNWFPQDDILSHPKVILFVTHGGLLSTTESIYHGKPVIGIPIFGDQFLNMGRAERYGYGVKLDYLTLSAKTFKAAIERVIANPSYTKLVKEMSARYRDQPMKPLDLAVHWVEHVARHKGATYLHCAGLDLNFIQYHNIDAMLILYGGIVAVLVSIILFLRFVLRKIFGKKNQKKVKKH